MPRLAWFSPMPPVATGVAACSADLVAALRDEHEIDIFVDEPVVRMAPGTRSAHDFVWRHQQQPYDLTVYQVGNSSHHDYLWPYLFRYPGLTVLHDAHLHHARAASLLRRFRAEDYRTEFAWNHPDENPDTAELAVAGFDNHLYYAWPMTRLVARASKLVAVHGPALAARLQADVAGRRGRIDSSWPGHAAVDRGGRRRLAARPRTLRHPGGQHRLRVLRRAVAGQAHPASAGRIRRHAGLCSRRPPAPRGCGARTLRPRVRHCAPRLDRLRDRHGLRRIRRSVHRLHRRLRRSAEPALAHGARNIGAVAAVPGRRQTHGHRRSRPPDGRSHHRPAHLAAKWCVRRLRERRPRGHTLRRRDRHPRRRPLAPAGDEAARNRRGPPCSARPVRTSALGPDAFDRCHGRGLPYSYCRRYPAPDAGHCTSGSSRRRWIAARSHAFSSRLDSRRRWRRCGREV